MMPNMHASISFILKKATQIYGTEDSIFIFLNFSHLHLTVQHSSLLKEKTFLFNLTNIISPKIIRNSRLQPFIIM